MTLAAKPVAASSHADFFVKWADSLAEEVLGKPACVESTWQCWGTEMCRAKPGLWARIGPYT